MTGLGLSSAGHAVNEIRVGFRGGWVRSIALTLGGASLVGLGLGALSLAQHEPAQVFGLLSRWGFVWLLALAAMVMLWDLAKVGIGYLSKLADSVQDSAVAMARIADRDDRERDRMATEIAYLSQRMERHGGEMQELRQELGELRGESKDFQGEVLRLLRGNDKG